jgi:hypothetical protein
VKTIDRKYLKHLVLREQAQFVADHPVSKELFDQAKSHLFDGVPMSWMVE